MQAELERRLGFCGNLPSLPVVALRIIELANNPEVHLNDVARVVAMDPALVAKLFRAANSPLYGLRRKATNLRQVLNLLGLQGTLALALGFSLVATSRDAGVIPLDTEQFWRRSLLAATACRILGERLALKNLEELFLAGLLHGIGIMTLAIMIPDRYGALLAEATDHQPDGSATGPATLDCERLAGLEQERLGIDHAQAGAWLLQHWRLPEYLYHAAAGSLDPTSSNIPEQHRTLVECVALAVRVADIWIRPGYWQNSPQVAELARQWLGLGADDYVEILEAVGAKFPDIADMFQIKTLDAVEVAGILDQAREVLMIRNAQRWPDTLGKRSLPEAETQPLATAPSLPTTVVGTSAAMSSGRQQPVSSLDRQYSFDALTGLFNRQRLHELLRQELANAKSQGWPVSVALLDLDGCARMNETRGRDIGDQILMALGRLLGGSIRRHDVVARYGDDEFALLLPASGMEAARYLLDRLLTLIRDWEPKLKDGQRLRVTVSAGLATYPNTQMADSDSAEQLLYAVEYALRAAKDAGGDRLAVYGE